MVNLREVSREEYIVFVHSLRDIRIVPQPIADCTTVYDSKGNLIARRQMPPFEKFYIIDAPFGV